MRRARDGYVLVYVLIVVVVLCLFAMTVCTIAVRNLQSQTASIERSRSTYAAEGEIEKLHAAIENITVGAEQELQTVLENTFNPFKTAGAAFGEVSVDNNACVFTVTVAKDDVCVTAKMRVTQSDGTVSVGYDSYDISTVEPATD